IAHPSCHLLCLLPLRLPPTSPLFPYTTLFRSRSVAQAPLLARDRCTARARCRHRDRTRRSRHCALVRSAAYRRELPHPRNGLRRSEEHTSELQSRENLVCRLLLEKKKNNTATH